MQPRLGEPPSVSETIQTSFSARRRDLTLTPSNVTVPHMPRITPEIAREYAARSAAARKLNKERAERAKLNPPAAPQLPSLEANEIYVARRLAKVRDLLDRVDVMFENCRDPVVLDRLAAVLSRLSELERQLANRPLPGSRRPRAEAPRKTSAPAPLDD